MNNIVYRLSVCSAVSRARSHHPLMEGSFAKLMYKRDNIFGRGVQRFWCLVESVRADAIIIRGLLGFDLRADVCIYVVVSILKYRIAFRLSADPFYFNLLI